MTRHRLNPRPSDREARQYFRNVIEALTGGRIPGRGA